MTKNNILEQIEKLPDDKILVLVVVDTQKRKLAHQYLDGKVFKTSMVVEKYFRQKRRLYRKCWQCAKTINVSEYRKGVLPNNKDEYYWGWCDNCNGSVIYEPNYDGYDEVKVIRANNAIVIGKCFQYWHSPNHATIKNVNKEQFIQMLVDGIYFILDAPKDKLLSKKKLRVYINGKIK